MFRRHSYFIFGCVLSLFVINFTISTLTFAQDTENETKNNQRNKLEPTIYDDIILGTALDLDGKASYVETEDSESINNILEQVTVSLWIKPTRLQNRYASIIFKGDERVPDIKNRSYILNLKEGGSIQLAASPGGAGEASLYSLLPLSNSTHGTTLQVSLIRRIIT